PLSSRRTPSSTLFPSTTLFRSRRNGRVCEGSFIFRFGSEHVYYRAVFTCGWRNGEGVIGLNCTWNGFLFSVLLKIKNILLNNQLSFMMCTPRVRPKI